MRQALSIGSHPCPPPPTPRSCFLAQDTKSAPHSPMAPVSSVSGLRPGSGWSHGAPELSPCSKEFQCLPRPTGQPLRDAISISPGYTNTLRLVSPPSVLSTPRSVSCRKYRALPPTGHSRKMRRAAQSTCLRQLESEHANLSWPRGSLPPLAPPGHPLSHTLPHDQDTLESVLHDNNVPEWFLAAWRGLA